MIKKAKNKYVFLFSFLVVVYCFISIPKAAAFFDFNLNDNAGYLSLDSVKDFLNEKLESLNQIDYEGWAEASSRQVAKKAITMTRDGKSSAAFSLASVFSSVKDTVIKIPQGIMDYILPPRNSNNSANHQGFALSQGETLMVANQDEFKKSIQEQKLETEKALSLVKSIERKYGNLQREMTDIKDSGLKIEGPVIEKKTIEKTLEKTISGISQDKLDSGISALKTELNNINTNLINQINNLSSQTGRQNSATFQAIALTNRIDNLSGTKLSNITVSGISGLTDADIPDTLTASLYLPLIGGTLSGNLIISGTATSSFAGDTSFDSGALYVDSLNNRVGVGTTSPSDTLALNGPAYLSQISAPSVTADRLYNTSGDLYWAGNLIGGSTTGNWTLSGGNVYRPSGSVGVGTTSPFRKLSVAGRGWFDDDVTTSYFTATSSTASIFPYASSTAFTVSGSTYLTGLGQGWLHTAGGINSLTASTSPTVNYLTATSTTATSTFAGGLNVESGGLVYDYSTNRVGIGTAAPASVFHISPADNAKIILGTLNTADYTGGIYVQGANSGNNGGLVSIARGNIVANPENAVNFIKMQESMTDLLGYIGLGVDDDFAIVTGIPTAAGGPTTGTTRLKIKSSGNVGIGTTSPSTKLSVGGAAGDTTGHGYFTGGLGVGILNTVANTFRVGQCVTGDTKLRRRRRRKKSAGKRSDLKSAKRSDLKEADFDNDYLYDEVAIKDIQTGDEIASLDEKNGKIVWSRVKQLAYMGKKPIYKITTASGKNIRTTANHPYLARKQNASPVKAVAFIDYANIKAWTKGKNLSIDLKALYSALKEAGVSDIRFYYGTDNKNNKIASFFAKLSLFGYAVITKQVQYFKIAFSELLKQQANMRWLEAINLPIKTTLLNEAVRLDNQGVELFAPKANFDVEITVDALRRTKDTDVFILFSGDGDFAYLLKEIKALGKKGVVVSGRKSLSGSLMAEADKFVTLERLGEKVSGLFVGGEEKQNLPQGQVLKKCTSNITDLLGLSRGCLVDNINIKNSDWTKAFNLKEGTEIAVSDQNSDKIVWDSVAKIETLPTEDVYDVEIENTHNFIGNDIVAHNTAFTVDSTGSVGIGTTSPYAKLSVEGSSALGNSALAGYFTATTSTASVFPYASTTAMSASGSAYAANFVASSASATSTFAGGLAVETSGLVYDYSTNNVGIGTAGPGAKLDTAGRLRVFSTGESPSSPSSGTGIEIMYYEGSNDRGRIYAYDRTASAYKSLWIDGSDLILQSSGGSVGIGTTSPSTKLAVGGAAGDTTGHGYFTGGLGVGMLNTTANTFRVGQCVTGDTKLRRRRRRRADGSYEYDEPEIIDIKEGDEIASLDEKTGKLVWSKVKQLAYMGKKPIIELVSGLGRKIRTTGNHPYFAKASLDDGARQKSRVGVFIDNANLFYAERRAGWRIDLRKFRTSIEESFDVKFVNYYRAMPDKNDPAHAETVRFIDNIKDVVTIKTKTLKYIEIAKGKYEKKGDMDVEIVLDIIRSIDDLDAIILVTGDSDFVALRDYVLRDKRKKIAFIGFKHNLAWELRSGKYAEFEKARSSLELGVENKTTPEPKLGRTLVSLLYSRPPSVSSGGVWTKVSGLKTGREIAVIGKNDKPVWDKIIEMRQLPTEDVYDVEIENTHNFIGNDIVAHNTAFTVDSTGSVGIGTTSPYAKLSVEGSSALGNSALAGYFTATTSTASVFPYASTTAMSASGSAYAANFVASSASATSTFAGGLAVETSGLVYDYSTNNVGIGTAAPISDFHFKGDNFIYENAGPSSDQSFDFYDESSPKWSIRRNDSTNLFSIFESGVDTRFAIKPGGSVGIGTTSPYAKLSVEGSSALGNSALAGYFTATTSTASVFPYASSTALTVSGNSYLGTVSSGLWNGTLIGVPYGGTGWAAIQSGTIPYGNGTSALSTTTAGTAGNVLAFLNGVPTWTATSTLSEITGTLSVAKGGTGQTSFGQGWLHSNGSTLTSSTSPTVAYLTATSTTATSTFAGGLAVETSGLVYDYSTGYVGIGTAGPGYKLDIAGDTNISAGSAYKYNGSNVVTASTTLSNYFFGGAGNLTTTGAGGFNNGVGFNALNALTTGVSNNAMGAYALRVNTTGDSNTALGHFTLFSNTTGTRNLAVGNAALFTNVVGDSNTAIGYISLYNSTGSNNTALGSWAGDNITTGSNNLIIGYDIDAPSATASNQLNIGNLIYSAGVNGVGTGFSTGNIGISSSTPWAKLSVHGLAVDADTSKPLFLVASSTASATTTHFIITNTGNVGIGTTSPSTKLSVGGAAGDTTGHGYFTGGLGVGMLNTTAGTFNVAGQCVTADTLLRRRRRRKKGETDEDLEKSGALNWDNEFVYDEIEIIYIKKGDEVASLDQERGVFVWSRVNGLLDTGIQPLLRITTLSGRTIRTTANHPYFARVGEYKIKKDDKKQKLYKFEVDLSMKIEQYGVDTVVAIANAEQSYTFAIPNKVKQQLRDVLRSKSPREFQPAVYAVAIVEALKRINTRIHELVIDTDYPSHEDVIVRTINASFPNVEISFAQVGKKSPAHFACYGVHKKQKIADYTATIKDMDGQTKNALPASFLAHKGASSESHQAFFNTNSLYDGNNFVKHGKWTPSSELRIGQQIAVAHGNTPAWERIVAIKSIPQEQVYDIEIDGTHNFIGNDIVAHNTYIGGNLGIGTTSPYAKLSVEGSSALGNSALAGYFTATTSTASVFPYASTTALTVSGNSYLGTISSGLWNGTLIGVPYGGTGWAAIQSGTIPYGNGSSALSTTTAGTAGNVLALLNGVPTWTATSTLAEITGTLSVSKGGTGQTSFGQGWLHSNGSTLTSSTSPTVAYLTATSTTATSTFAGGLNVENGGLVYDYSTNNVGIGTAGPTSALEIVNANSIITLGNNAKITAADNLILTSTLYNLILRPATGYKVQIDTGNGLTVTSGNVGIGTTTPNNKLDIYSTTKSAIGFSGASGDTYKWTIGQDMADAGKFKIASSTALGTLDRFVIDGNGNIGIGTTSPYAKLSVEGSSALGNSALAGYFTATSTTTTSTFAGGLAVETSGLVYDYSTNRVGIGTASPSQQLEVYAVTPTIGILASGGGTQSLQFGNSNSYNSGIFINDVVGGEMDFRTGGVAQSNRRMFISNVGLVGIGTTSPYAKLSVEGSSVLGNSALAGYFTATSTTATSTISGGLSLAGGGISPGFNFSTTTRFYQNGQHFLTSSTTAAGNLTIGYQSASKFDESGGLYNTGIGYQALGNATSTSDNVAIGYQALLGSATISTVGYNTAVGHQALRVNTTGHSNNAFGRQALFQNTTGRKNQAFGLQALYNNTTGDDNIAIGQSSLSSNISGVYNVGIGASALEQNTNSNNVSIGSQAVQFNTSGSQNTGIGSYALNSNVTGSNNVGIGFRAGFGVTGNSYNNNVLIGYYAGSGLTTGSNNILLGLQAGDNITTGSNNLIIGYDIDAPSATASNQLNIGNLIFSQGINGTGTTLSTGNIGIGTTSPYAKLSVEGSSALGNSALAGYFTATTSTASVFPYASTTAITSSGSAYFATSGGRVGIGTAAPENIFHISGSTPILTIEETSTGRPFLLYKRNGIQVWDLAVNARDLNDNNFYIREDTDSDKIRLTIQDSTGNIGIGTTSPYAKLSVEGSSALGNSALAGYFTATSTTATSTFAGKFAVGTSTPGASSLLTIGTSTPLLHVDNNSGFVGIGTAAPAYPLDVLGTGTGAIIARFNDVNSTGCTLATGGTISCSSDITLKKNIEDVSGGLDKVLSLHPVLFNWKTEADSPSDLKNLGFIAQEVELILPKLVSTEDGGIKQLNTIGMIPVLTKAIQEQQEMIEGLKRAMASTTNLIASLSVATNGAQSSGGVVSQSFDWILDKFKISGVIFEYDVLKVKNVSAEKVKANEICVGNTCVTEEKFKAIFGSSGASSSIGQASSSQTESSSSASSTDTSIPVTSSENSSDSGYSSSNSSGSAEQSASSQAASSISSADSSFSASSEADLSSSSSSESSSSLPVQEAISSSSSSE